MIRLRNFEEAHRELDKYIPPMRSQRGAYTLDRIKQLMDYLGRPQDQYKTVHIAGTSGKTSTAYYAASLLQAHGQKVGLTVSPHVDEVNERVQVNLESLTEKVFCRQLSKFLDLVKSSGIKPTYFELLVAFAYWQFAEEKVDYAVIEVGLGGLLDGTNVITRSDKVCILTDIGLDHTSVLGKTLEAIATQKAGIIQPYNPVFCYKQSEEVMDVFREVATQKQADLHEIEPDKGSTLLKELPLFQRRNWQLAFKACEFIAERDKLPALTAEDQAQTLHTYIPARMEEIPYRGRVIILDGAHNAQKLEVLVASIRSKYPKQDIAAMVAFVQDKKSRMHGALDALLPHMSHVVITAFSSKQDMPRVSIDPLKIVERCEEKGFTDWEVEDDPAHALKKLLKRPEPVLLVAGSFYLLNHVRPQLLKKK